MTNYNQHSNPERIDGDREFLLHCVRRVDIAPDLVEQAARRQFGESEVDAYAAAAKQAQAISDAQRPADVGGNIVPLNADAAASQARLLARPSGDFIHQEVA